MPAMPARKVEEGDASHAMPAVPARKVEEGYAKGRSLCDNVEP